MSTAEHHEHHRHRYSPQKTSAVCGAAHDPVCGMSVLPDSEYHAEHKGAQYLFCSAGCQAKFQADPDRYAGSAPATPASDPQNGITYTCPMHPQIRQPRPGNCPICGMALEPENSAEQAGPNPELIDMTRRFWLGVTPLAAAA